jgi:hypothetical protein
MFTHEIFSAPQPPNITLSLSTTMLPFSSHSRYHIQSSPAIHHNYAPLSSYSVSHIHSVSPLLGILWCLSINSIFSPTGHWNIFLWLISPLFVYLAMKTGVIIYLDFMQLMRCLFGYYVTRAFLSGYYATHAILSGYYATLAVFHLGTMQPTWFRCYAPARLFIWVLCNHHNYLFGFYPTCTFIVRVLCNPCFLFPFLTSGAT